MIYLIFFFSAAALLLRDIITGGPAPDIRRHGYSARTACTAGQLDTPPRIRYRPRRPPQPRGDQLRRPGNPIITPTRRPTRRPYT